MTRIHRKNLCSAQENTVVIRHYYKDYRRGSYSGQRNDAYKNEHNNCGKKKTCWFTGDVNERIEYVNYEICLKIAKGDRAVGAKRIGNTSSLFVLQ